MKWYWPGGYGAADGSGVVVVGSGVVVVGSGVVGSGVVVVGSGVVGSGVVGAGVVGAGVAGAGLINAWNKYVWYMSMLNKIIGLTGNVATIRALILNLGIT